MSVFEVQGGRVNRRYLERKSKFDLCSMYLDLLDQFEKVQARADLAAERERGLVEALSEISTSRFCDYEQTGAGMYGTGVTDGHRYCAEIARKALAAHESRSREGGVEK